MSRRISIVGNICKEIKEWLNTEICKETRDEDRIKTVEKMSQSISQICRVEKIEKGGVLEWIRRDPIVVHMKKVNGRISSSVFMGKDKEKKVRVKVEIPNMLSGILGVNTASIEGTLQSLRAGIVFGHLSNNWTKERTSIVDRWKAESKIEKNSRDISITRYFPSTDKERSEAAKIRVVQREGKTAIESELESTEVKETKRSKWKVEIGREIGEHQKKKTRLLVYAYSQMFFPILRSSLNVLERYSALFRNKMLVLSIEGRTNMLGEVFWSKEITNALKGSVQGVCTVRASIERFGVFIGGVAKKEREKNSVSTSFIFGGVYAPAKKWIDAIELSWSPKEIYIAEGILKKIAAVSIHISKEC